MNSCATYDVMNICVAVPGIGARSQTGTVTLISALVWSPISQMLEQYRLGDVLMAGELYVSDPKVCSLQILKMTLFPCDTMLVDLCVKRDVERAHDLNCKVIVFISLMPKEVVICGKQYVPDAKMYSIQVSICLMFL